MNRKRKRKKIYMNDGTADIYIYTVFFKRPKESKWVFKITYHRKM